MPRDLNPDAVLRLGVVTVDITPDHPVPLAGFAYRRSEFTAVHRSLFAKIWVFEQEGGTLAGECERTVIVQADLIWWGSERMPQLYREVKERWGIREASVLLHATHTHCGPQTSERFTPSLGLSDPDYVRELESRLLAGIGEAIGRLEPVVLERGLGTCRIGIHRRRQNDDGTITMAPNPEGPMDPEVVVIRYRTYSGEPVGVWFHYSCHPTTINSNTVTSEYPGVAMELIERRIGAPASFLQGCCGDIRPAVIRDGQFISGTLEDIDVLGRALAEEVIRILDGPMKKLAPAVPTAAKLTVRLPLQPVPVAELLLETSSEDDIRGEWSRLLISAPERLQPYVPLELTLITLAQDFGLLAFDAEMVVEYGSFVKSYSGGSVLPLPYSNGMIGYVPTSVQVEQRGYEALDSIYYFGLPSPFEGEAEPLLKEAIKRLLDSTLT